MTEQTANRKERFVPKPRYGSTGATSPSEINAYRAAAVPWDCNLHFPSAGSLLHLPLTQPCIPQALLKPIPIDFIPPAS